MQTPDPIINKVAQKNIITIDLADLLPAESDMVVIDMKDFLFKELILREADFREQVKSTDWSTYRDKYVVLYSSVNAIIPMWAYMVISAELAPYIKDIANADPTHAADIFMYRAIEKLNAAEYEGQRIVIKGCGDKQIDAAAFVYITQKLAGTARALMYGEPCSMVPVYKRTISQ